MCLYGYQLYITCAHRLIKLAALCRPVLFELATLSSATETSPCSEEIYTSFVQGNVGERSYWQLFNGRCPICSGVKPSDPDNDEGLARFIPMNEYEPVLLRPENAHNTEYGRNRCVPASTNQVIFGHFDNQHPYLRILPHLLPWSVMLGVDDQVGAGAGQVNTPMFQLWPKIAIFDPSDQSIWKVRCGETRWGSIKDNYLFHNGGLTRYDREYIRYVAEHLKQDLWTIYCSRFAARGMTYAHFTHFSTNLPEITPMSAAYTDSTKTAYIKLCELRTILKLGPPTITYESKVWKMYPVYTPDGEPIDVETFFSAEKVEEKIDTPLATEPIAQMNVPYAPQQRTPPNHMSYGHNSPTNYHRQASPRIRSMYISPATTSSALELALAQQWKRPYVSIYPPSSSAAHSHPAQPSPKKQDGPTKQDSPTNQDSPMKEDQTYNVAVVRDGDAEVVQQQQEQKPASGPRMIEPSTADEDVRVAQQQQEQQPPPGPPMIKPSTGERTIARDFTHYKELCNDGWYIDVSLPVLRY